MTEGERKNMKQDTLEGRAKTKNGVKRLCFSAVCILLEAAFIIAMITKLNQYAEIINLMTRLLALGYFDPCIPYLGSGIVLTDWSQWRYP